MARNIWLLALLTALSTVPRVFAQDEGRYDTLVNDNTRFAFKFFRQSLAQTPDRNVITAPTALSTDFAFLQNGAETNAREEILHAFDLENLSADEINKQNSALRKALSYSQPPPKHLSKTRPNDQAPPPICCSLPAEHLVLAGSLWVQPVVAFRSKFFETGKKFYLFHTASVPDRGPAAVKTINAWAAQQTGGKLTHVLDSWQKDDFLLLDTTWFKGTWFNPFWPGKTHPGDFTLLSGQKKEVPMMEKGGSFRYLRGDKFQAVRLAYHHAAMYVFLPDEDSSLKDFEQSLTADNWAAWTSAFKSREGYLELPRFQSSYRGNVTAILGDLGIKRSFAANSSFAPAVSNPEGARLTRVLQVVLLTVDEKGTEVVSAGIVGGVVCGISTGPRPEPFRMIVNRPFFFVICDDQTQAILYMGAIVEP
ncbi:MAG: serpin family protein [Candidatus Sulfotelmatobacter sp.]